MAFAYQPLLGPVGVSGAVSVNANVGAYQIAGGVVAVRAQRRCNADAGNVVLTEQLIKCGRQKAVTAYAGSIACTGLECKLVRALSLTANGGSIAACGAMISAMATRGCITDQAEFLLFAPSVEIRRYRSFVPLEASAALIAASGQNCGIFGARRLLASEGIISVNGKSATVYRDIPGGGGTPTGGAPATASISIAIGL